MGEDSPCRLLVEGRDDQHSVIHLMMKHGIDWDDPAATRPHVYACEGFHPLLRSLPAAAKTYECLGIMIDADADIAHRWNEVRGQLLKAGVTVPDSPSADGAIVPGMYEDWKVGVWIMPDNEAAGELEDFLGKLIPPGDTCWEYARQATQHAKEIGARFPSKALCKACLHTWLAWQENPGLPFGTAITAKYFDADSPEALRFVQWFKTLFG